MPLASQTVDGTQSVSLTQLFPSPQRIAQLPPIIGCGPPQSTSVSVPS